VMVNVAPVVFPAASVSMNIYVPVVVINVPLMYIPPVYSHPLSVAVTHSLLSKNSILIPV
jgi:hypothetical protein